MFQNNYVHLHTETFISSQYNIMYIIIIANGAFPQSQRVLDLLGRADHVVCCDGAFEKYYSWCRQSVGCQRQVVVVGDGDSLQRGLVYEARLAGMEVSHIIVSEQESNDLSKAVHYIVNQMDMDAGVQIDILGATGFREDHTLGNISLLAYYATEFPSIAFRMISDYGVFQPAVGQRRFVSHKGQQVSLFSFTPTVPVSVVGLRYPIENRCLTWLWEGTLNESLGDEFEVIGGTMVVYQECGKQNK